MATLSEWHKTLTNGVGKCSVPMWCNGMPADFCDAPAYGEQIPLEPWQRGIRRAYAPALACPSHGGPREPRCAPGCLGIDIGDGNHSGCECKGAGCDCPQHPASTTRGEP